MAERYSPPLGGPDGTRGQTSADLSSRSAAAASRIAFEVASTAVRLDAGRSSGWGQFIESSETGQIGFHSTCAALELLSSAGSPAHVDLIREVRSGIEKVATAESPTTLHRRRDQVLTHSAASAAAALASSGRYLSLAGGDKKLGSTGNTLEDNPAAALLLSLKTTTGWGWWRDGQRSGDQRVRVLPTCAALSSLADIEWGSKKTDTIAALEFLAASAAAAPIPAPAESSAIALTLLKYRAFSNDVQNYAAGLAESTGFLVKYAQSSAPDATGNYFDEHCAYRLAAAKAELFFVTYPVDVLVAYALTSIHNAGPGASVLEKTSSFATTTAMALVRAVEESGVVRAQVTNKKATADQLWTYKYLSEFSAVPADALAASGGDDEEVASDANNQDTDSGSKQPGPSPGEVRSLSVGDLYEFERVGRLDTEAADRLRLHMEPFFGQVEILFELRKFPKGEVAAQALWDYEQLRNEIYGEKPGEPLGAVVHSYFASLLEVTLPLLDVSSLTAAAEKEGKNAEPVRKMAKSGLQLPVDHADASPAIAVADATQGLAPGNLPDSRSRIEWVIAIMGWSGRVATVTTTGLVTAATTAQGANVLDLSWMPPIWAAVVGAVIGVSGSSVAISKSRT